VYSEHRSLLSKEDQASADRALAERLLYADGGPLTLGAALDALEVLIANTDPGSLALLSMYRTYLLDRIARAKSFCKGG
ncbi:hypothetical protein, partial [Mesorhizobium sp. M1A.F.Ca.IN.020.32.1.1]